MLLLFNIFSVRNGTYLYLIRFQMCIPIHLLIPKVNTFLQLGAIEMLQRKAERYIRRNALSMKRETS